MISQKIDEDYGILAKYNHIFQHFNPLYYFSFSILLLQFLSFNFHSLLKFELLYLVFKFYLKFNKESVFISNIYIYNITKRIIKKTKIIIGKKSYIK